MVTSALVHPDANGMAIDLQEGTWSRLPLFILMCLASLVICEGFEKKGAWSRLLWFILMHTAWLLICNEFKVEGAWSRLP